MITQVICRSSSFGCGFAARWFTIVVASLNFIVQLGFVGSYQYPLWALTAIGLNFVVLYALMVRWGDVKAMEAQLS